MKDKRPPTLISIGVLAQLSGALVAAIVIPLLLGIAISRFFDLGPIAVVCVMAVGLTLGSLAVYRIVKRTYDDLSGGK